MQVQCGVCGESFEASRASAKWCGERCKKRAQRAPGEVVTFPGPSDASTGKEGPLTRATRVELAAAGREYSSAGVEALLAAARLDGVGAADTGAGVAALMKARREAMAEALKDVRGEDNPLEAIRASAALKLIKRGA